MEWWKIASYTTNTTIDVYVSLFVIVVSLFAQQQLTHTHTHTHTHAHTHYKHTRTHRHTHRVLLGQPPVQLLPVLCSKLAAFYCLGIKNNRRRVDP